MGLVRYTLVMNIIIEIAELVTNGNIEASAG